jgi:dipeptidyl-peptidase-3
MKKSFLAAAMAAMALVSVSCSSDKKTETAEFNYKVDRFADIEILRYKVTDFENLTPKQKELVYYLTEAALYGRDILTDQNGKYNLAIRTTLEEIYKNFNGDKESADYKGFVEYLKQVWFANGIHHHYSTDKFVPKFSQEFFKAEVAKLAPESLPLAEGQTVDAFVAELVPVIFDPTVMAKRVNQADGQDLIQTSANNYYDGVTQAEVEQFYAAMKDPKDTTPISYGLNSRLVKKDGKVQEEVYKVGGRYSAAIEKIVENLKNAQAVAENEQQKAHIGKLIEYYTTGNLKTFDEYSILWVEDVVSTVDFINGFIESYGDPLGLKGAWESIVNFKNEKASHRTEVISANAQWFEDHSPVDARFKKDSVKGVTAKVITAAILAGDAYPATPIGINLPNANWIRAAHGSKSVTIENITEAYDQASHGNGFNEEFVIDKETGDLMDKYLFIVDNLHTDLHECLGHGSGKLLPGVHDDALKEHGSTLEETRADLFALYYLADPKLLELGLVDNKDAYKAEYYKYILNGMMTQLMRIEYGKNIEESHMRNRQLISMWAYENGKAENVIELVKKDGKTFIKINDYEKLRGLFGKLLAEVQRIKSEGDYAAGKKLVEDYAVKVNPEIHKEVLERYGKLDIAPYKGFVNPVYTAVKDAEGNITDVTVDYSEGYVEQMLRYSKDYSPLTK